LSKLTYLELDINQLTGSIPAELGNMSKLRTLILFSNNLTGPIPPELGNLSNLDYLVLDNNQLSGTIPAELGNLTELTLLGLSRNQFSGFIPTELSKLSDLSLLYLACNKLTGQIPSSLADLRYLSHSNLHWNGLHTDDNDLRTFLNDRTTENWESTQTIAPENILCRTVTDTSLTLTWTPITFTQGTGGYRVFYSSAPKGPFTEYGMTSDKTIDSLKVTGLFKRKTYYFKVQTQTNPHMNNQNTVVSEYSDIISSTNTRVSELEEEIIKTYALLQNYPNPFNPETIITYSLPKSSQVILTVYNLMGQPVRTLVNKKMPAGTHQVIWNAKNERGRTLPTGIYFYVIKSGSYTKMRKALLMK